MDLNGDRRAELIASGASTLQVWTAHDKGLARVHPRRHSRGTLALPTHRHVKDAPTDAEDVLDPAGPPLLALAVIPHARAPSLTSALALTAAFTSPTSFGTLASLSPRPPPLSF